MAIYFGFMAIKTSTPPSIQQTKSAHRPIINPPKDSWQLNIQNTQFWFGESAGGGAGAGLSRKCMLTNSQSSTLIS
ncbi:unnamed protein product [Ceratitis capitata]|uniref:(Mediterranean fruit fly) hypothetical protein n=1 Tax=Ceratitis capitata TaxID=7213 RepID=A0A811V164_CERCA|nr:unnamed protein product [Ceratitis capitata]